VLHFAAAAATAAAAAECNALQSFPELRVCKPAKTRKSLHTVPLRRLTVLHALLLNAMRCSPSPELRVCKPASMRNALYTVPHARLAVVSVFPAALAAAAVSHCDNS
jgi:hypothetical protein